jgi:hypothetical protein
VVGSRFFAWCLLAAAVAACATKPGDIGATSQEFSNATPPIVTNAADALRTGWYGDEDTLSPALVGSQSFGRLFSTAVDGQVYAQPLVANGTLLVVTETNHLYALDAVSGAVAASRALPGTPFNPADVSCSDLLPSVGVTGTPVIDSVAKTAYFLAKSYANGTSGPAAWDAHAVDLATLAEKPGFPVRIEGAASNDPASVFEPTHQHQRPGLLLLGGVVYAAFGAHCDASPYKGWVAGISTAGKLVTLWTTEAGAGQSQAGIWQAGGGIVSDAPGQLIVATGNGPSPAQPTPGSMPPRTLGESVIRLSVGADGSLSATDFFTPYDAAHLNSVDGDLGSGAPVGLPDSFGTGDLPHLLVQVGKEGYLYVLNRDALGGFAQGAAGDDLVVQRLGPDGGLWGRPSVWPGDGGYVYTATNGGSLKAYAYGVDGGGKPTFWLAGSSADAFGYTSGSAVITSSGTTPGSGLVWIVWSSGASGANAQLRAYDAVPVGSVMHERFRAPIGTASKFAIPGVAGGRVYVGTRDGHVLGFGSPTQPSLSGPSLDFGRVIVGQSGTASLTLTADTAVTVSGVSSAIGEFSVGASTPPLPATLAAGDSLTVALTFQPSTDGLRSATLTAATSAGSPVFGLTGTGEAATAKLVATPAALSLGGAAPGQSVSATAVFVNDGAQPLTISSVQLPTAPFSGSGLPSAGATLASGQSVVVTVMFSPQAAGYFEDAIGLTTTGGTVSIPLSATAGAIGTMAVAPLEANAGNVALGATGLTSFQLTNTGKGTLTVLKSKAPAGAAFSVVQDIPEGTTIGPGATATAVIRFTPQASGTVQDTWVLNADDGGGVRNVGIVGTGTAGVVTPADTNWTVNGSASFANGTLTLTPAAGWQAGSAFWPTAVASSSLTVDFDANIDGGSGADGLALVFADPATATPSSLGVYGGGLGFSGISGVAVALDTYQNAVNPSANFVGISDGPTAVVDQLHWLATSTNVPPLRGATHHVSATLDEGSLTVAIDGVIVTGAGVALPPNVLVGFTGGSGGLSDRHAVSNVSVSTDPISGAPGPMSGGWALNGTATMAGPSLSLTAVTANAAGSAFWPTALPSASLHVSFDATLAGGTGADGLALVLADPQSGATASSLGASGGGLGFSGTRGIAVALDTYQNAVNPSANFVGVTDGPGATNDELHWLATATQVPPLRSVTRHVGVSVNQGTLTVWIDGVSILSTAVTLPDPVLVGFSGGSGAKTDNHAVANVAIGTDPLPQ